MHYKNCNSGLHSSSSQSYPSSLVTYSSIRTAHRRRIHCWLCQCNSKTSTSVLLRWLVASFSLLQADQAWSVYFTLGRRWSSPMFEPLGLKRQVGTGLLIPSYRVDAPTQCGFFRVGRSSQLAVSSGCPDFASLLSASRSQPLDPLSTAWQPVRAPS